MFQKAVLLIYLVASLKCPFLALGADDVFFESELTPGTRNSAFDFASSSIIIWK
jgi:hypothetical protein